MTRATGTALVVLLTLTACGGGGGRTAAVTPNGTVSATGPADAQVAEVDGKDTQRFAPNVVHAAVGTLRLTVHNAGQVPHNLEFDDSSLGGTRTLSGGQSQVLTVRLTKPGTYRFVCTFHDPMTGQVVVH